MNRPPRTIQIQLNAAPDAPGGGSRHARNLARGLRELGVRVTTLLALGSFVHHYTDYSVEILLWLVPAAVATLVAMVWVSIVGRDVDPDDRSAAAKARQQERFAEAIQREHGVAAPRRTTGERSTGVAVRGQDRRSA